MGRKPKAEVIAELIAKGIEFDENARYVELYRLLKVVKQNDDISGGNPSDLYIDGTTGQIKSPPEVPPDGLPIALIERAKKVGFTDEQIATYTDSERLEMACNRIKPQTTPQPEPKKRQIYRPFREEPKGEPAQAVCTSQISTLRAENVVRAGYDESNMGVFCRQHNPKILPERIQKVTIVRDYIPNKRGILTSEITIDYLKKG